jgi:hypothetical protein
MPTYAYTAHEIFIFTHKLVDRRTPSGIQTNINPTTETHASQLGITFILKLS